MLLAAGLGLGSTWLGVLLSYDSYAWPPAHHGWPVSFLVVALIFTAYLGAELACGGAAGGAQAVRSPRVDAGQIG